MRSLQPPEPSSLSASSIAEAGEQSPAQLSGWPTPEPLSANKDTALYKYLPALDGLRAISVLWVLSVHWPRHLAGSGFGIVKRGALGVEIFFAISGFLVTRSLHQCVARAENSRVGNLAILRDFLVRRVARIWPPYFLALSVALGGMLVDTSMRGNLRLVKPILWSFPTFLANYTIPRNGAPLSLIVMWSLCFEEQFYLLLIALYLAGPKRLSKYIVAAALASIAARVVVANLHPASFSHFVLQMQPHWRFDAIAWGCLAWVYRARVERVWQRSILGWQVSLLLASTVALCILNPVTPQMRVLWFAALAAVFTLLVTALSVAPAFWLQRLLAWPPLVVVGSVSYEIYLSHISVFRVLLAVQDRSNPVPLLSVELRLLDSR